MSRSEKAANSWKDPIVRAKRLAGLQKSSRRPEYIAKQSSIRTKFLKENSEAMSCWRKVSELGRKEASTKKVCEKRNKTLAVVKRTKEFRKSLRAGLLRAVVAGKFNFVGSKFGYGKKSWFVSRKNRKKIFCASSWESKRVKFLEGCPEVLRYIKEPYRVLYKVNGESHYYYPDFLVEYVDGAKVLEEVKPKAMLEFSAVKAKMMAVKAFCRKENISFRFLGSSEELTTL